MQSKQSPVFGSHGQITWHIIVQHQCPEIISVHFNYIQVNSRMKQHLDQGVTQKTSVKIEYTQRK